MQSIVGTNQQQENAPGDYNFTSAESDVDTSADNASATTTFVTQYTLGSENFQVSATANLQATSLSNVYLANGSSSFFFQYNLVLDKPLYLSASLITTVPGDTTQFVFQTNGPGEPLNLTSDGSVSNVFVPAGSYQLISDANFNATSDNPPNNFTSVTGMTSFTFQLSDTPINIPEPSSFFLLLVGMISVAAVIFLKARFVRN